MNLIYDSAAAERRPPIGTVFVVDLDVDGNGASALERRREHGHALLGERVGQVFAVLPATAL